MKIGIYNSGPGIGDQVVYSSLPENYWHGTGEKLIDVRKLWVFDHNPYIVRRERPDKFVNLWSVRLSREPCASLAERICEAWNLPDCPLRHARLYAFEDEPVRRGTVVVHATGKNAGSLPEQVIAQIARNYADWEILQVGAETDRQTPFRDCRGLPLWDSIRLVATCEVFIGVDSGMMNVANCYPRVRRKVVILREPEKHVPAAHPLRWIDFNWEYFNPGETDRGITMSYRKI